MIVAFDKADDLLRTPPLLDPSDVLENPDEWSMMTYISYLRNFVEDITLHSSPSPPGLLNITGMRHSILRVDERTKTVLSA